MLIAFLLALAAGSATVIGALAALHPKMIQRPAMAVALGFAAGAMLFVSFAEMLPASLNELRPLYGNGAMLVTYSAFFAGLLSMLLVDKLLPKSVNPSEREGMENTTNDGLSKLELNKLRRSGLLIAVAIGLHNLPEGLITFMSAIESPALGVSLALAIAIHNIPEGIAVAAPIYAATGNKKRAFTYASLSGLAEPLGAFIGFWLIGAMLPASMFGIILAAVGGIMVFICLDELLPAARRYGTREHQATYGVIGGMLVMAISLVLLSHAH